MESLISIGISLFVFVLSVVALFLFVSMLIAKSVPTGLKSEQTVGYLVFVFLFGDVTPSYRYLISAFEDFC